MKALMYLQATSQSHLREKPGLLSKIFGGRKPDIVFCINSAQLEVAEEVLGELGDIESSIKMLRTKSNNKIGF